MNYLLVFRILLGAVVLGGFGIRCAAVSVRGTQPSKGRLRTAILATLVLYAGVVLSSIHQLQFGSVCWSAAALVPVAGGLEVVLQAIANHRSGGGRDNSVVYLS